MEAVRGSVDSILGKNGPAAHVQHGLYTPEGSLEPDAARIDAEKARQAAEATRIAAEKAKEAAESTGNSSSTNQTDPPLEDSEDEDEKEEPTEEQSQAVQRVLECKSNDYRNILGVQDKYDTPEVEQKEILNAFRELGTLIHPDYIKGKRTRTAYERVLKAAARLGVDKDDINEVKTWDGEEELGDEMEAEEKQIPWPSKFVQQLYSRAGPELLKLLEDPTNPAPMRVLEDINTKIREQNEKNGDEPGIGTIDYQMYAVQFNDIQASLKNVWSTSLGQPFDEEAMSKVIRLNEKLKELNHKHHFPETWTVPVPTREDVDKRQAKTAEEKAAAEAKAAEAKAAEEKAAEEAAAAEAKTAEEKAAAEAKAAEERAAAAKGKFGNIEFPWKTHLLPTGERIIAGRQRTKDDVAGSICCVELPCANPEDPTFELRDDIDIFELQKYFATPNIKLMGETDKEGRPVKVWSKADRKDFRNFLFCVVGKRRSSNLTKRSRPICPEVLCGIAMENGVTVVNKTALIRIVGEKAGEGYVRRYCKQKGITSPWDVEPDTYIISKEMKKKMDALNSTGGSSLPAWPATNIPNPPTESLELKSVVMSLSDRIAAMEKKLESPQPSDSGSTSAILTKIEERLAAMETKVANVDSLAASMAVLSKVVQELQNKSQESTPNASSA